jgi:hypothetical protein
MINLNNNQNNWNEVKEVRKNFVREDVDKYPYFSGFNYAWDVLCQTVYSGGLFDMIDPIATRDADEKLNSTPFEAFRHYMGMGTYPPPELLVWLNDAFTTYLMGTGKLELEEVLFGKPKPSIGNFASRNMKGNDWLYERFYFHISYEANTTKHGKTESSTLVEMAEKLFIKVEQQVNSLDDGSTNKFNRPDIETFLRGYRRWKTYNGQKQMG